MNRVIVWICTFLCLILSVILVLNVALMVKRYCEQEASLNLFGHFPVIILSDKLEPTSGNGDLAIFVGVDPEELAQGDLIVYRDKTNGMLVYLNFVEKAENGIIVLRVVEKQTNILISTDQVIGICAVSIPVLGWVMDFLTSFPVRMAVAALMLILFVETYFYMLQQNKSDNAKDGGIGSSRRRRKLVPKKARPLTSNRELKSPPKKRHPLDFPTGRRLTPKIDRRA